MKTKNLKRHSTIKIRQADKSDCYLLATRLRQQDLDELEALGVTPLD
ncbi:hypothetical protein [Spartinivicinus ruber]|nr:hypothetical protein [Spartinivicinus ruber]